MYMARQIRELSSHEVACAKRLKQLYEQKKKPLNVTQYTLAEKMGISQSGVWQYLNGYIPLNLSAIIRFAKALECQVQDIDPEVPDTRSLTDEEWRIIDAYRKMGESERETVLRVAEMSAAYRATSGDSEPEEDTNGHESVP